MGCVFGMEAAGAADMKVVTNQHRVVRDSALGTAEVLDAAKWDATSLLREAQGYASRTVVASDVPTMDVTSQQYVVQDYVAVTVEADAVPTKHAPSWHWVSRKSARPMGVVSAAAVKAVPRRQWEGPSYVGSTVELDSAARLDAIM